MNYKKASAYIIVGLIFVMCLLSLPNELYMSAVSAKNSPKYEGGYALFPLNMLADFHDDGETYALGDGKYVFVEINGMLNKLMHKNVVNDAVKGTRTVRLAGGGVFYQSESEPSVTSQPEKLIALSDALKTRGIELCFCAAPSKVNKYGSQDLYYKYYSSNDNTDILLQDIADDVDTIDFREDMPRDDVQYSACFFNTDHHWTLPCTMDCFKVLAAKLKSDYGFEFDDKITDKANYTFTTFEDCFVGSQGRRVGSSYGGKDDFSFPSPNFETSFTVDTASDKIKKSGSFSDVFILNTDKLKNPNLISQFSIDPYAMFVGGNIDREVVTNQNAPNEKKILLIHDSFGKALLPFLSMTCGEVSSLDLRYFKDETLIDYIDEYQPDTVIICYALSMFRDDSLFDFGVSEPTDKR